VQLPITSAPRSKWPDVPGLYPPTPLSDLIASIPRSPGALKTDLAHFCPGHPLYISLRFNLPHLASLISCPCEPPPRVEQSGSMPATFSAGGGASLAPTPAHPHQLSRQPSKEDLEMAENLNLLNHSQDRHSTRRNSNMRTDAVNSTVTEAQCANSPGNAPEISEYHSLEDTLNYQRASQPEQSPTQTATAAMQQRSQVSNAPITGQICR
jgi:hypothetical protein